MGSAKVPAALLQFHFPGSLIDVTKPDIYVYDHSKYAPDG